MAVIPINSDIKMDDYWQIRALSVEWLYVLQKLNESVMAKAADRHCLLAVGTDGSTTYLLSKKFYTPTTIAKATGLSVEKLEAYVGMITLKSPKSNEGLPDATVPYWGTA